MPCRPAISSHSLGRAWVHDLEPKLDQAARYGFDIELFYEDLHYFARKLNGGPTPENQLKAARIIRSMCTQRNIAIVCLQPFMDFEGLRNRERHQQKVEEFKFWLKLAAALDTRMISIPSTFLSPVFVSGDQDLIVRDLQEVADLAALSGVKIAYESLAWGTHVDTWEGAWEIVQKVGRANFGICLDTFNIAAKVYADPTSITGRTANAIPDMRASLARMRQTIDVSKVFYLQVVDAERLTEPLVEGHAYYKLNQHPRMSWSRNCRLFYGESERGAYLPIQEILHVILKDLGFQGWVSAELFNSSLADSGPGVPREHGERAAGSWRRIVMDLDLEERCVSAAHSRLALESVAKAVL